MAGAEGTTVPSGAVTGFNRVYVELLKAVKAGGACRGAIKRHYRKFDHEDASHVARWTEWTAAFLERFLDVDADVNAVLGDATLAEDTRMFEEVYLEQVVAVVPRPALAQYLYALAAMARLHEIGADDAAVAAVHAHMAKAVPATDDAEGEETLDDVPDERVRAIVRASRACAARYRPPPVSDDLPPEVAEQMRKLENTKIGRMAREISATLGPETLADPAGLAAVIGKVGGVMQAKMRAGEIDHGELLGEAMGMIGSLPAMFGAGGGGGAAGAGLADLFKSMGGAGQAAEGAGQAGLADMLRNVMGAFGPAAKAAATANAAANAATDHKASAARTRLAAKLAARKKEAEALASAAAASASSTTP